RRCRRRCGRWCRRWCGRRCRRWRGRRCRRRRVTVEQQLRRGGRDPEVAPVLARLVGSAGAQSFADQTWGRNILLGRGASAEGVAGLFSLRDADELLADGGLRTPFLRIARDGNVHPDSSFTRSGGVGAGIGDQVDADRVTRLLAEGATVVFQGLHRVWRPVAELVAALTAEAGHPVQANAYLTPPSARGFSAHFDTHDVFVVQTAGTKRWRVHRPVVVDPAPADGWTSHRDAVAHAAAGEPVLDHVMAPGDVLYLPR